MRILFFVLLMIVGNGKYKALVNNSGNAIITVFNIDGKKKLGLAYFFVNPGNLQKAKSLT